MRREGADTGSAWRTSVAGVATLGLLLMAPPTLAAEPEGFGNNLSMAVIWAEDTIGPALRGDGSQTASLEGNASLLMGQRSSSNRRR